MLFSSNDSPVPQRPARPSVRIRLPWTENRPIDCSTTLHCPLVSNRRACEECVSGLVHGKNVRCEVRGARYERE